MTRILRSAYWVLPCTFLLILVFISGLSGCHPGGNGGGTTDINKDSVKAHILSIATARHYTANFRAYTDSLNAHLGGHPKDSAQFGHAEAFNIDCIRTLLAQVGPKGDSAVGIRIYYGRDDNGLIKMILVPYDKNNNDIINVLVDLKGQPSSGAAPAHTEALTVGPDGQTIENGQHCPTICDDGSSGLNGGN